MKRSNFDQHTTQPSKNSKSSYNNLIPNCSIQDEQRLELYRKLLIAKKYENLEGLDSQYPDLSDQFVEKIILEEKSRELMPFIAHYPNLINKFSKQLLLNAEYGDFKYLVWQCYDLIKAQPEIHKKLLSDITDCAPNIFNSLVRFYNLIPTFNDLNKILTACTISENSYQVFFQKINNLSREEFIIYTTFENEQKQNFFHLLALFYQELPSEFAQFLRRNVTDSIKELLRKISIDNDQKHAVIAAINKLDKSEKTAIQYFENAKAHTIVTTLNELKTIIVINDDETLDTQQNADTEMLKIIGRSAISTQVKQNNRLTHLPQSINDDIVITVENYDPQNLIKIIKENIKRYVELLNQNEDQELTTELCLTLPYNPTLSAFTKDIILIYLERRDIDSSKKLMYNKLFQLIQDMENLLLNYWIKNLFDNSECINEVALQHIKSITKGGAKFDIGNPSPLLVCKQLYGLEKTHQLFTLLAEYMEDYLTSTIRTKIIVNNANEGLIKKQTELLDESQDTAAIENNQTKLPGSGLRSNTINDLIILMI